MRVNSKIMLEMIGALVIEAETLIGQKEFENGILVIERIAKAALETRLYVIAEQVNDKFSGDQENAVEHEFEIWAEGFAATGERGIASLMGIAKGITFKEACINYAMANKEFASQFNPDQLTHWGCRLFNNEAEARLSFG
jgi:hypothetical protein